MMVVVGGALQGSNTGAPPMMDPRTGFRMIILISQTSQLKSD